MKIRLVLVLFFFFTLGLSLTMTAAAQGPKPTPTPAPRRTAPELLVSPPERAETLPFYGEASPSRDQAEKPLGTAPFAPRATSSPKSPKTLTLGAPGLSYRYLQTFGTTESAYLTPDAYHLNSPGGLFIDNSDNLYVAENFGYRVLKYNSSAMNLLSMGTAGLCIEQNSPPLFCAPNDMAVRSLDSAGNFWVATGSRVAQYDSSGACLQQMPGSCTTGWSSGSDNTHFNTATGIAFDSGGRMYVADYNNHRVQVYSFSGSTPVYSTTIGVTGVSGSDASHFYYPVSLVVDSGDNLYVTDYSNYRVQKCTYSGGAWSCSTFATGLTPNGIARDSSNNIYIAQLGSGAKIWKCTSGGICNTSFITDTSLFLDVAVDSSGNVYAGSYFNSVVRKFNSSGVLQGDYLGSYNNPYSTDGAHINTPWGIAVDSSGNIFVTERYGYRLLKLSSTGVPQWAIGTPGVQGCNASQFSYMEGKPSIVGDSIYIPVSGCNRIQVFNATDGSYIRTFGSYGTSGNDKFWRPNGIAVSPVNGDFYVVDRSNHRIQVYDGTLTLAGYKATIGVTGVSGSDNSHFNNPRDVAIDSSGNVYVADQNSHRVQKCTPSYTCTTFAGTNGSSGLQFDRFNNPYGVAVDSANRVYVVDSSNYRVQVFDSSGAYLTTIGGDWGNLTSRLRSPSGIALDSAGNVYVADRANHRVQKFVRGVPGWLQTNLNGFGDYQNYEIDSLTSFGGQLYAGTFQPNGAQLWRTGSPWTSVTTNGFGDTSNVGIEHMLEFNGQLYAGTWNCAAWNSSNACIATNGGQIWRSSNGSSWSQVTLPGFDNSNSEIFQFATFNSQLYASAYTFTTTHGAEIWRSSTGNSSDWTRVMTNGFNNDAGTLYVAAMVPYNSYLYATKFNSSGMAQVWRCSTCDGSDWGQVNTDGFDGSTTYTNTAAVSLAAFNGYLYAGTRNLVSGAQIWRCSTCDSGGSWTQVVGPSASTPSGFGKITNTRVWGLLVYNNMLYALVYNSTNGSTLGTGMEVWRTSNGVNWEQVGYAGLGTSNNTYARTGSATVFNNNLYLGTINSSDSGQAQVWEFLSNNLYLPLIIR